MTLSGFRDNSNSLDTKTVPVTVNPLGRYRDGLDVLSHQHFFLADTDVVEASSTVSVINAAAHNARRGDYIVFTSGALIYDFACVFSTTANTITLSQKLISAPVAAVTFQVLRYRPPLVTSGGAIVVSYGTPTALTPGAPSFVSVGASSALFLAANAARTGLIVTNLSANLVSFSLLAATPAVLNSGITLPPYGVWNMGERDFTVNQINAIASVAASVVSYQEFS